MIKYLFPLLLAGCATPALDANYAEYLKAQREVATADRPLLRIKAQPGATVRLEGVDEFVVYAPNSNANQVATYQTPRNDAVELAKTALGVVGTVGGIVAAGSAAKGLATAVGSAANHGYQYIQAPGAQNLGTGVLGSGTYNYDTTHTPTVVTTPNPVIVTQPSPTIVNPVVVTQPSPTIVNQPPPIIVETIK